MGLVNRSLPRDDVVPHSIDYVKELARTCAPSSLATMKEQLYQDLARTLGPAEIDARRRMMRSFRSTDFKEGVAAFQEKRPPRFARLGWD